MTLSAIFFFLFTQFLITFICVPKSLNDEERGGNCLLVPERSYGPVDVMYSDFEKAFDKVSHNRLIYKLKFQQRHYYLDSRFPKRQKI